MTRENGCIQRTAAYARHGQRDFLARVWDALSNPKKLIRMGFVLGEGSSREYADFHCGGTESRGGSAPPPPAVARVGDPLPIEFHPADAGDADVS